MQRFRMETNASVIKALTIPRWLVGKSIVFFFVAFALCTFVYGYPMDFRDAFIAGLSVVLFFYGGISLSKNWERKKAKVFVKNVFLAGLMVRFIWVLYCYYIFNPNYYGNSFGIIADVEWYMPFGQAIAEWLTGESRQTFEELRLEWGAHIDDVGYPVWLAIVNLLTAGESDVFVPFVFKCIASAYCSICIYHVAKRHFGEEVARMAAIFVCVNPNMIYWCGNMFKEAEMVFLCCVCVDLVDKAFSSKKQLSFQTLLPGVLVGSALFFFRAALAVVIFLAIGAHIIMASNRVMGTGKKIVAGVLVLITLLLGIGDSLRSQTEGMIDRVQSDSQKTNMEWRSERKDGYNSFAKYASATVFAPLIFTIPFPSFNVAEEGQILQRQLSGGSYIKNVLSFFVIMVMLMMLISGEWRRHVFILVYTVGYLMTLVLSEFAQSGRFHMPVMPMLMLFAAYGVQIAKTNWRLRKWYSIVLVIEVVACLLWNWYKLAGRGMV